NNGRISTSCPDDQVIIAVQGNAGDAVDGLEIRCAEVGTSGDTSPYALELQVPGTLGPHQGGLGGDHDFDASCPPDTIAVGLELNTTRENVLRLRLQCQYFGLAYPK
ncbi:MAG: hypothetical protein JKY37_28500, partial [Nannocystaceae bacterium]|nr:hypothetical protein [Nannocystaceae bacterium]